MPRKFIMRKPDNVIKKLSPFIQKYFPYHKNEIESTDIMSSLNKGSVVQIPFNLAVGQVYDFTKETRPDYIRVQIKKLCINRFLLKYFYQDAIFWAHKNDLKLKTGDIVLVEKIDPPIDVNVILKVKKLIFEAGNIVDPVSGLKCQGKDFDLLQLKAFDKVLDTN